MERQERYYHSCPACGMLTPYLQGTCDCGYHFRRKFPKDHRMAYLAGVLSVLLVVAFCYAAGQYDAGYSAGLAVASTPSAAPAAAAEGGVTIRRVDTGEVVGSSSTSASRFVWTGQIIVEPQEEGVAPLSIETSGDSIYYVALAKMLPGLNGSKPTPSSATYMSFIVRGGDSTEVLVPLGEYKIYYATGSTWCGREELFGSDTVRYECEGTFDFYYAASKYEGWTLTLYAVAGGNMGTERIAEAQFPK